MSEAALLVIMIKEEVSPELSCLEEESAHIEVEKEDLWTTQEQEQLTEQEEADEKPYCLVIVKSESEEKPQSPTEANGGNCEASQPGSSLEAHIHLQPDTDDKAVKRSGTEDWQKPLSDSESEDRDDGWTKTTDVSDTGVIAGKNSFRSSNFCTRFDQKCLESQNGHEKVIISEKTFACSICGKRLQTQRNIKRHMRIHTGETPYSCDICGKRFRVLESMKTHISEHTGVKPCSCEICGKTFMRQQNMTKHMRIHTGEKPFSCGVCGKRFRSQDNEKRHMRQHTGERPFSCHICGKSFSVKERVEIHMIVHTREKPFSCDVCGRGFTQKQSIKRHIQLVHSKEKM